MELSLEKMRNKAVRALTGAGVPAVDAAAVADSLLDAEIIGVSSHGLMRLPSYVSALHRGRIAAQPALSARRVGECMYLVDGGNGLGQVVTLYALDLLMQEAALHGCAVAAIRHSNHFGTAGYYTRLAAQRGLLAFATTNASATMPPYGGRDPKLGTNPFSVSFPAGRYGNFTLDVATSAAARGKIRLYEREGKPLPSGWAIDADGNDTTDPAKALAGGVLPMGAHKGYGMSMVVDYLSGIVPGASLCYETKTMFSDTDEPADNGHFLFVMDIGRFGSREELEHRTEDWAAEIKSSRPRPGFSEILLPGELEQRRKADNNGTLRINTQLVREIEALGEADGPS